jgi:hypothetical protein
LFGGWLAGKLRMCETVQLAEKPQIILVILLYARGTLVSRSKKEHEYHKRLKSLYSSFCDIFFRPEGW